MSEQPYPSKRVEVESYSGYKASERPVRLKLREATHDIISIEDRWYAPGATYFRVLLDNGDRYLLRYEEGQDVWSISGYRAAN